MNLFDRLKAPFPPKQVHWRVGATNRDKTQGLALAYIDARDVMHRLDEVAGPGKWQNRYPSPGCCEIGIQIDGEWVWKSNGAGQTDVEGEKGQYSDAFKRAAVMWGIGRYLYFLENLWAPLEPAGNSYKLKGTPALPAWATPEGYLKRIGKMNGETVSMHVIDEAVTKAIQIIERDDPETGQAEAQSLIAHLSNDEKIEFFQRLKGLSDGKQQYAGIFNKHLDHPEAT